VADCFSHEVAATPGHQAAAADSAGAESKIACTSTIDPERRYMKKLDLIIILAYI